MSLLKAKMTEFQVEANYWTVIKSQLNFHPLPKLTFDELGEVNGTQGGAMSEVVLGLFISHESYNSQLMPGIEIQPMELKRYDIPFDFVISAVRNGQETLENITYNWIKANDPFFVDAQDVE